MFVHNVLTDLYISLLVGSAENKISRPIAAAVTTMIPPERERERDGERES